MATDTEEKSKLIAMHDLHFYSDNWMRCVTKPGLCGAMADLLGEQVSTASQHDARQAAANRASIPDALGLGFLSVRR